MGPLFVTIAEGAAAAGASVAAVAAVIGVILKSFPERRNLTVDAAAKAVGVLKDAMDELAAQLEDAHGTIAALQSKLDVALTHAHELDQALAVERGRVAELEQRISQLP